MGRKVTLNCDFCGKEVEIIGAKVYLAMILPGKALTSFMAGYSYYADICTDCMTHKFVPKMKKRQARTTAKLGKKK